MDFYRIICSRFRCINIVTLIATLAFTPLPNSLLYNVKTYVTNYEYSINNGSIWLTPSAEVTTRPLIITGLTDGTYGM
jgi:hypothetical protein